MLSGADFWTLGARPAQPIPDLKAIGDVTVELKAEPIDAQKEEEE